MHRLGASVAIIVGLAAVASASAWQRGAGTPPAAALAPADPNETTIRPPFSSAPETIYNNSIPHGAIHRFTMKSEDSKIYKGISRAQPGAVVPYERPVAVY